MSAAPLTRLGRMAQRLDRYHPDGPVPSVWYDEAAAERRTAVDVANLARVLYVAHLVGAR